MFTVARSSFLKLVVGLAITSSTSVVRADGADWSSWRTFNSEQVSVSFSHVRSDTWTWRFRNDGGATITYMQFEYTDKDGTHPDVLPMNLKPGEVFGGWAAFTASSNPTIRILKITKK